MFRVPVPGHEPEVYRAIQTAEAVRQHQWTDCVRSCGARKPLRTAEMTLEDDCVITGEIVNNGRRGEKPEKAQDEARRTMPEKNLHPGELGGC